MKLYVLNFNDSLGTREQITTHLDKNRTHVQDWYYCMPNTMFIASTLTAQKLIEYLQELDTSAAARYFVQELNTSTTYYGWLPEDAWKFVDKYKKT